ncbi:MAG: hypothetical protein ACM3ZQ_08635 [Bacillota bacterium]
MSSGRRDPNRQRGFGLDTPELIHVMKLIATASLTVLCISLMALVLAPRDPGTMTVYGLVIAVNVLLCLSTWLAVKYLQRIKKEEGGAQ